MNEQIEVEDKLTKKKHLMQSISFTSNRRFGIEFEYNSFDGKNRPEGGQPKGIDHIANIVSNAAPDDGCEIRAYEHTNNNKCFVVKPDSSCGMEVVTPPKKGWRGLRDVLNVVKALSDDPKVKADNRCSVHVHVEIEDLSEAELASVVCWWVKCEPVIMDAMPMSRKRNRYCQIVGMNNNYQHNGVYSDNDIIRRVGDVKYYSLNSEVYCRTGRKTIEFRVMEAGGCRDPYLVKQWVRFLLHFVEITSKIGRPLSYYEPKNEQEKIELTPWTGMAWMDPIHTLSLLGFYTGVSSIPNHRKPTEFKLSNGLQQTKNWFLARLMKNMSRHKPGGMRHLANNQLDEILKIEKNLGNEIILEKHLSPTEQIDESIFGEQFIY